MTPRTLSFLGPFLVSLVVFVLACATPGVAPGDAQKGFVVWGFVGHTSQSAATGTQVMLVDAAGQPVQAATTDAMGKYVFSYHRPGAYQIVVGQLAMPVTIAGADQRLDIDLSNPTGMMNYATVPPKKNQPGKGGQGSGGGQGGQDTTGLPSLDEPVKGSDCWASAGCDYDSSTDTATYEDTTPSPSE